MLGGNFHESKLRYYFWTLVNLVLPVLIFLLCVLRSLFDG